MPALTFDLLLEYLSALGRGTWQTFKPAATMVSEAQRQDEPPRWQATAIAENLAVLGHVEFAFDTSLEWVAAAPAIAVTPTAGPGYGVLCGARTSAVLQAVEDAAREMGVPLVHIAQDLAPSVVELHGTTAEQLATLAGRAGLAFEPDVGSRLGRCLPSLDSMYRAAPDAFLPLGFPIRRFDPTKLDWQPVQKVESDGSFLFDSYRPEYRIVAGGFVKKVSRSVAIYVALAKARKPVVQYAVDEREMALPSRARPPVLYGRALALCSGRLPGYDPKSGALKYPSIPTNVAFAVKRGLEDLREDTNG